MNEAADSRPTCSAVVLTYRSARTIEACLDTLVPQVVAAGGEVVVVDNGSDDDTVARVRSRGIEPVAAGGNLGFARGCNLGARHARGRVLLFVNPDAMAAPGCVDALLAAAAEHDGPLGAVALHEDGSYDRRSVLGRPSLLGACLFATGLDRLFRGSPRLDPEHGPTHLELTGEVREVPAVSGALFALRRSTWDALGGFDERYFLYGEDVDLCLRAATAGHPPALVGGARHHHVGGVSSAGTSSLRDVLLYRGKATLYRRHLAPPAARLAVAALAAGTWLRGLAHPLALGPLREQARPWWRLWQERRAWRAGYEAVS